MAAADPPRLIRGFLSLTGAEAVGKVVMLATFAFVARVVGPAAFGDLEFALSAVMCAAFLVDQGYSVFGAREIARSPEATPRLVSEVASLRLVLAVLVYAGLGVFVWLRELSPVREQLVMLYGLSLFAMPLVLTWVYQGHDAMRAVAGMQFARTTVFALAVFALLRDVDGLWTVAVAEVGATVALAVLSVAFYRRCTGQPFRVRPAFSPPLLRVGTTIGLSQLFWALRTYGATVIVGLIATGDDVGYFGGALRIAVGLNMFVWLYFFNLLPAMSRAWHQQEDPGALSRLLATSIRTAGWLAVVGGPLWVLLSPLMIGVVYGEAFAPATQLLQWMCAMCVLGVIHGNFRFGLIAAEHQRFATVCAGVGTVVALALIPWFHARWGVTGAAMALLVGEVAVWISSFVFSRRLLGLKGVLASLVRPALAGGMTLTVLWALPTGAPVALRVAVVLVLVGVSAFASEPRLRSALSRGS